MGIESWNRGLSIWLQRLEALYYGIPQTRGTDQARLPSLFLPVKVISRSSEKMIVHAPVRWISRVWEHRSPLSGIMFSNSHYSGRWSRKLVTFPNFLRARTPRNVNSDSAMQAQMHKCWQRSKRRLLRSLGGFHDGVLVSTAVTPVLSLLSCRETWWEIWSNTFLIYR